VAPAVTRSHSQRARREEAGARLLQTLAPLVYTRSRRPRRLIVMRASQRFSIASALALPSEERLQGDPAERDNAPHCGRQAARNARPATAEARLGL